MGNSAIVMARSMANVEHKPRVSSLCQSQPTDAGHRNGDVSYIAERIVDAHDSRIDVESSQVNCTTG